MSAKPRLNIVCFLNNTLLHKTYENEIEILPDNDNDKVEDVPAAAQIGACVQHEAVCYDLDDCFRREDHYKHVLHSFLYIPVHTMPTTAYVAVIVR